VFSNDRHFLGIPHFPPEDKQVSYKNMEWNRGKILLRELMDPASMFLLPTNQLANQLKANAERENRYDNVSYYMCESNMHKTWNGMTNELSHFILRSAFPTNK